MAGEPGELGDGGPGDGRRPITRSGARAALGRARRVVGWIATAATGGESRGVQLAVRLVMASLPLLMIVAVVVVMAVVGGLSSLSSSTAGGGQNCLPAGLTAGTGAAAPSGAVGASVGGSLSQRFTELQPIWAAAAQQFDLGTDGWAYLAAINYVETTFGTNMSVSSAGAVGWMQFEPSTFVTYAVNVPGVDTGSGPDPYNPYDAIYAAANMLHADGAPGNWNAAIYSYNHAGWYVSEVESLAVSYARGGSPNGQVTCTLAATTVGTTAGPTAQISSSGAALAPASAPLQVQRAIAAGNEIIHTSYLAQRPEPLNQVMSWYDCSASTDFVLYNAGLNLPGVTAGGADAGDSSGLETYGDPGPGRWITIFTNPGHAFIEVAGIVMDTAWYAAVQPASPSSGPRWQPGSIVPAQIAGDAYGGFVERHPPGL